MLVLFYKKICYYIDCGDVMKRKTLFFILIVSILFVGVSVEAKGLNLNILDYSTSTSCTGYFGSASQEGTLMNLLVYNIFRPIQWLVPILLLILTTLDFGKVVFTDSKDGMEKAKKNFVKRAIMAVVIFFIPTLLEIIFQFVDNQAIKSCLGNFN